MADQTIAYTLNKMFPKGLADATFREPSSTFLALINKDTSASGDSFEVAVQTSLGGGRSADFATARRNNNGGLGVKFRFPYADDFSFVQVPAKEWEAAKRGGGVTDILKLKMGNGMKKIRIDLANGVTGDGSGAFARIATVTGTSPTYTVTVTNKRELVTLERQDSIQANPNRTGSPGTMRAGTGLVTSVNRPGASFTLTAAGGFVPQVNDYLYVEGDYGVKMNGLRAWIPDAAPLPGDSFGGVDRSVDPDRLAGLRVDATTAADIESALIGGLEDFRLYSCNTNLILMSVADYTTLEKQLGAKKRIVDLPNKYEIGLSAIQMADGSLVARDPYIRKGFAYAIDRSTWTLMSMGDAPQLANEDGLKMLRISTADVFEAYIRSWSNVKCDDPSQNGVIFLPP